MRLVANISVGDEVELIDQVIRHHQDLGVDAFVIADVCSTDGTREKLVEWNNQPNFHVIFSETKNFLEFDWRAEMVRIAREQFGADYILRVDADEFVFAKDNDIRAAIESAGGGDVAMRRMNVVWPTPDAAMLAASKKMELHGLPIAANPVTFDEAGRVEKLEVPWILSKVQPRIIARARSSLSFKVGAHNVVGQANKTSTDNVFVAHLPFTSLPRFRRKMSGMGDFMPILTAHFPSNMAWHWRRWVAINEKGEDAVLDEFLSQFMTPEQAETLTGHKTIVDGSTLFDGNS